MKTQLFLSYSHYDNKGECITNLKEEILFTIKQRTALDIDFFQDKYNIRHGSNFNKEIYTALDYTNIFIPIITPYYFKSLNCRKELKYFFNKIKKDSSVVIMPIYFIPIKPEILNIFSSSIQVLFREITKLQYFDLTSSDKENLESIKEHEQFSRFTDEICMNLINIYKQNIEKRSKEIQSTNASKSPSLQRKKQPTNMEELEIIKSIQFHLKKEEKPRIMICGKVGNGKTSTINTLFRKKVGKVNAFKQGTIHAQEFNWTYENNEIILIDLPGLGVSRKKDEEYSEIYQKYLDQHKNGSPIHAILMVLTPPRLAEGGAIDTLNLILNSGYPPESIIFGINKIHFFDYETKRKTENVVLNEDKGLSPRHKKVVEEGKKVFLEVIHEEFPNYHFEKFQCVEYDAKSGWNIFTLLHSLVTVMPYTTLIKFMKATDKATEIIIAQQKDAKIRQQYEEEKKNLIRVTAQKITNNLGKAINFISKDLGKKYEEKKPAIEEKLTKVIKAGKELKSAVKDFFSWW